jgi:tagatose-1,6-bisphosphate aldolase non-catalytic subunit AgaZ/GatZ
MGQGDLLVSGAIKHMLNSDLPRILASQSVPDTILGVGPMSKNCVDVAIEIANERRTFLILIASRRQIDAASFGGGYVNNWTTPQFAEYVRRRDRGGFVLLARDHGGPWQHDSELSRDLDRKAAMSLAMDSFEADIDAGFDILHIDPNRNPVGSRPADLDEFTERTKELLYSCKHAARRRGREVSIEIGTDEGDIGLAEPWQIESMVEEVVAFCRDESFHRPAFLVVQTGTKVMEMRNVGWLDDQIRTCGEVPADAALHSLMTVCRRHGFLVKEHNADYLSDVTLRWHPRSGMHSANVAPEFGVAETHALLGLLRQLRLPQLEERFLTIAFESRKWEKWMLNDSTASDRDRAVIAGHYVFSTPEFAEVRCNAERVAATAGIELDEVLRTSVKHRIARYLDSFRFIEMPDARPAVGLI